MAKLKITAFKKGGKYYAEETRELIDYPTVHNVDKQTTVDSLQALQASYCYGLWQGIQYGNEEYLSPVTCGFKGYIFVFNIELEISESGFLTYLLDRTEK